MIFMENFEKMQIFCKEAEVFALNHFFSLPRPLFRFEDLYVVVVVVVVVACITLLQKDSHNLYCCLQAVSFNRFQTTNFRL